MSFKKGATDPTLDRQPTLPGLPGGPAWVSRAIQAAVEFAQSIVDPGRVPEQPEDHIRNRPSRRRVQQKPKRRPNMRTISKRVRRKHRRAGK